MKNEVTLFNNEEFGEIRTLVENDGVVLFCATDVARALKYAKPRNAIQVHCRYALKRGVPHPQSESKTIEMVFIPEGDVYRLVFGAKTEKAEAFTSWVVEEVLPSIRKTGKYSVKSSTRKNDTIYGMNRDDAENFAVDIANGVGPYIIECLRRIDSLESKSKELERENESLKKRVSTLESCSRPQSESKTTQTANTLLIGAKTQNNVTYIAEHYGMTAFEMNDLLANLGIQFRDNDGVWKLTYEYSANDYARYRHFDNPDCPKTMYWTRGGLVFLYTFLAERGVYPKC